MAERFGRSCALFAGAKETTLEAAERSAETVLLAKGERVDVKRRLAVVVSGKLRVFENRNGSSALLNTLKEGDVFGFASLFGGVCDETEIRAAEGCALAVFDQETVETLMRDDFIFTKNYIALLTHKIRFLNCRISDFTADNAEKKLAGYLLALFSKEKNDDNTFALPLNMMKLASALDMGRASLYRAFDDLEQKAIVRRSKGTVTVLSEEKLKRIAE